MTNEMMILLLPFVELFVAGFICDTLSKCIQTMLHPYVPSNTFPVVAAARLRERVHEFKDRELGELLLSNTLHVVSGAVGGFVHGCFVVENAKMPLWIMGAVGIACGVGFLGVTLGCLLIRRG